MKSYDLITGDCLQVLPTLPAAYADTVITDSPYGLSFMSRKWDHGVPGAPFWEQVLRVTKPGGYLLAFGGTRTFHRLMVAIEDAGWEIKDMLMWLYGSGFPHGINIGKQVPEFAGWNSTLKPAYEPIILAMKSLAGTYAQNALEHGVAGLHIDACRIGNEGGTTRTNGSNAGRPRDTLHGGNFGVTPLDKGRWPSNVLLDEQAAEMLGEQARFFYVAKPSAAERDAGLEEWAERHASSMPGRRDADDMKGFKTDNDVTGRFVTAKKNFHPTVKPVTLLQYLARLTSSPTGGVILDPFMGSGSTGVAAILEGRSFIGIDKEPEYVEIARARIAHAVKRVAEQKPDVE